MPTIKKRFSVTGVGSGKPDYSAEIATGLTRPGIELSYNQYFRSFGLCFTNEMSLWPNVKPELNPGETVPLVEMATSEDMPSTVEKGHSLIIFLFTWQLSSLTKLRFLLDGYVLATEPLETLFNTYGFSNYFMGTNIFDPTALTSHTIETTITNVSDSPIEGHIGFLGVETILGSAFPKLKTVKCKWCGTTKKVKNEVTKVKCAKCGKETWYYPILRGGKLGK